MDGGTEVLRAILAITLRDVFLTRICPNSRRQGWGIFLLGGLEPIETRDEQFENFAHWILTPSEHCAVVSRKSRTLPQNAQTVEPHSLARWIDEIVAKEWGPHAAARVWNIINEGLDEVEQTRSVKPHELPITNTDLVPGACAPVKNLFHISQALSWIAGTRRTIPERLEYIKVIPRLMEPLSKAQDDVVP